ncbi:MAG: hypothetical protein VX772_00255, partial [Bacteroidota bacterium]|nr:hypothetical protein [Bacteroidota bacterium]
PNQNLKIYLDEGMVRQSEKTNFYWRNHKKILFDLKFILENVGRYNCFVCFSKIHENSSNKRTS